MAERSETLRGSAQGAPSFRFRPIVGPRASDEVVAQICFAIQSGGYAPGSFLPTSESLARMMGVSRPTIIEAVRALSAAGVVNARRGASGGLEVVTRDVPASFVSSRRTSWRLIATEQLVEAREPVEHAIVRLAHERGTKENHAALRAALDDMRHARSADDLDAWVSADHRFHYALGVASGNEVLAETLHSILEELALLVDRYVDEFVNADRVIALHERLVEALTTETSESSAAALDGLLDLIHHPGGE